MGLSVVICWADISGYKAACWRELAALPNVTLFVIAFQAKTETAFTRDLMAGVPCHLLDLDERQDCDRIEALVTDHQPDVVVVCGWFHRPYRALASAKALRTVPFIMGMDTPWWGTPRQRLAQVMLRPYLSRMAQVVVPGERSWQYARRLGIPLVRIHQGLYGVDYAALSPLLERRIQSPWPRSFLFVGRYVAAKGLDVLISAYQQYRHQVNDPWPLVCCGQGPLGTKLHDQPGIVDQGFVQPTAMATIWQQAGALVLPSRFDPWPLALVEGAAAGLPIICTQMCGSAVEVIRSGYNGLAVPANHPAALSQAMVSLHHSYADLPIWGKRAQALAHPYAAHLWAERWSKLLQATAAQHDSISL